MAPRFGERTRSTGPRDHIRPDLFRSRDRCCASLSAARLRRAAAAVHRWGVYFARLHPAAAPGVVSHPGTASVPDGRAVGARRAGTRHSTGGARAHDTGQAVPQRQFKTKSAAIATPHTMKFEPCQDGLGSPHSQHGPQTSPDFQSSAKPRLYRSSWPFGRLVIRLSVSTEVRFDRQRGSHGCYLAVQCSVQRRGRCCRSHRGVCGPGEYQRML